MPKGITNIAASVHQRLLNKAKELSRPFNELLQYFAIVDIGFGDIVVPDAGTVLYPTILDFQAPELKGYTMESTIAEKFQAMIKLGILNSRMKDFYDIWFLSHTFDFKGEILCEAIKKTFSKRKTPIDLEGALFDPLFGIDRGKDVQWRAFIRKAKRHPDDSHSLTD